MTDPITTNRPLPIPPGGKPVGPGRLTLPEANESAVTINYLIGDREGDRAWNGDGLHLSAEARLRNGLPGNEGLERVSMRAGIEGIEAKFGVVRNGEMKPRFEGISLRDGYFKGQVRDAGDYLKARPLLATGAVIGAVVVAHELAKEVGPIKIDTGKVKLYDEGGLTASVVGEIAITGDNDWIRAQGAKAKLSYRDASVGDLSLEAGYDRDAHAKVQANWSKTFDSGVVANAGAFYEQKTRNAGVSVGMSYRF